MKIERLPGAGADGRSMLRRIGRGGVVAEIEPRTSSSSANLDQRGRVDRLVRLCARAVAVIARQPMMGINIQKKPHPEEPASQKNRGVATSSHRGRDAAGTCPGILSSGQLSSADTCHLANITLFCALAFVSGNFHA